MLLFSGASETRQLNEIIEVEQLGPAAANDVHMCFFHAKLMLVKS